ncbi:MAG: DMT family transporter [Owenweeksia sp.]
MVLLSNKQVDQIHDLLLNQGVKLDSLRLDLLDHVCCLVEDKMEKGISFHTALHNSIKQFGEDGLHKTNEATLSMLNSKSILMKKISSIIGILGSIAACSGGFFKIMHWPGANMLLLSGIVAIVLLYLPLLIVVKFRETESTLLKFSYLAGLFGAMVNGIGVVFKLLHFPGANYLIIASLLIIGLIFMPIYFTHAFRLAENKLSNLAFAGVLFVALFLLYGLTNSGNGRVMSDSVFIMHQDMMDKIDRANAEREEVFSDLPTEAMGQKTEELLNYLSEFRTHSVMVSQNISREQAENINIRDLYWGTGIKGLHDMLDSHPKYNPDTLRSKLQEWQAQAEEKGLMNQKLCCQPVDGPKGKLSWEEAHFGNSCTILSLVSFLDQLKLEINQKSIQLALQIIYQKDAPQGAVLSPKIS